jgi:hypothetical protein
VVALLTSSMESNLEGSHVDAAPATESAQERNVETSPQIPPGARKKDSQWVEGADESGLEKAEDEAADGDEALEGDSSDDDEYFRQHFKAASEARPVNAGEEAAGEGSYEDGEFDDSVPGAGAEPEDSRYPPDLILSDGRVISRKPRPVQEGDELDESKKDITMANAMKEEGNRNFSESKYDTAAACYTEALRFAPNSPEFQEHKAVFYANRAACYLHLVS